MSEKDFLAEYAKSGRAACKGCKMTIQKDTLRLARMVPSRHFDGKQPMWYHTKCFFPKQITPALRTSGDIGGFAGLRWNDQKMLQDKLEEFVGEVSEGNSGLSVEYAKSNRSTCRAKGCGDFIEKGTVRLSTLVEAEGVQAAYGGAMVAAWHHMACFFKDWTGPALKASSFAGFKKLKTDDLKLLEEAAKATEKGSGATTPKAVEVSVEKMSPEDAFEAKVKKIKAIKLEREMKAQSAVLWKTHDDIDKYLTSSQMRELLAHNGQPIQGGENQLRERLADRMTFGALPKCTECKGGDLEYRSDGYACSGDLTAWTKCQFVTISPKRSKFLIPKEMAEEISFLKKFKPMTRTRQFLPQPAVSVKKDVKDNVEPMIMFKEEIKMEANEKEMPVKDQAERGANRPSLDATSVMDLPLEGIKVSFAGKLKSTRPVLKTTVEKYGGTVVSKVTIAHLVISAQATVDKDARDIIDAIDANIPVMSEAYLGFIVEKSKRPPPSMFRISPESKKRAAVSLDSAGNKKMKLTVKGRSAVDPASELEDTTHVYEKGEDVYSMVLALSDVARGTNSFYKLQVLEKDEGKGYYVFRSWGRIGVAGIGGTKLERFKHIQNALEHFEALFEEKTGNQWERRAKFVKKAHKFYPMDIDYGQEDETVQRALVNGCQAGSSSQLPKPVQNLVQLIFDVEQFKRTLVEFEIDVAKMPLGKLSKAQINKAYGILSELQGLIEKVKAEPNTKATAMILDASNRFYTLIPHDFGMKKLPLIDSAGVLQNKTSLLDNLQDMEIAASLLSSSAVGHEDEDPIDVWYRTLRMDIEVLDRTTEEFSLIQRYLTNTHAKSHSEYKLVIDDVFCVRREGDNISESFKGIDNHMLLWHGSRITNYAGILANGLRIAPPEAPVTGYMFGKGVYFADMVTKSANYCCATAKNPYGLLLLGEVALGNTYELTKAKYITRLPRGKHSTKGVGKTQPDPRDNLTLPNGTIVPCGNGVPVYKDSSLLYNEYIVYDVNQISMKYLLKVRFDFTS